MNAEKRDQIVAYLADGKYPQCEEGIGNKTMNIALGLCMGQKSWVGFLMH